VEGEPGSGKSHLIRWLYVNWPTGGRDLPILLQRLEVHPTGPLWGAGEPPGQGPARLRELAIAARFPALAAGLVRNGLQQERRALRLAVRNFETRAEAGALVLEFALPRGAFATAVLRELLVLEEPGRENQPSST
jgi:tRNA pseudouridine13 synthase